MIDAVKPAQHRSWPVQWIGAVIAEYRIWPVLALLVVLASWASGGIFLRSSNLVNVVFLASPIAIAAFGQTLVILTSGIDLSVAAVWVLSAVAGSSIAAAGHGVLAASIAALAMGAGFGGVNGLLIAYLRVPPLIATLGALAVGEGLARVYTGNEPILSVPPSYAALGNSYFGPVPLPVLAMLTALLAIMFLAQRTVLGKEIYAVGGNVVAARYAGLRVSGALMVAYTVSGLLAGLAGLLHSAYIQEAVPNVDLNTLFEVIAGVVVGGAALEGGRGKVLNSLAGVLVIVMIENLMNILGVSPFFVQGVLGLIVLVAVYLNVGFGSGGGGFRLWGNGSGSAR